ncbi:MAG: hypothetical protein AAGF24_00035 [Cyanobacteria bacterium P01_H01_bin.121]
MQFQSAPPSLDYPIGHLIDTTNQWQLGTWVTIMGGHRVRASRIGAVFCPVDYCAGKDPEFLAQLTVVMLSILEALPPEIDADTVHNLLPSFEIKPISKDPCWPALQTLAEQLKHGDLDFRNKW